MDGDNIKTKLTLFFFGIYTVIIIITTFILSAVLSVSTENTWLSALFCLFLFVPWFSYGIYKAIKLPQNYFILKTIIIITLACSLITTLIVSMVYLIDK